VGGGRWAVDLDGEDLGQLERTREEEVSDVSEVRERACALCFVLCACACVGLCQNNRSVRITCVQYNEQTAACTQ
jgi:hypothetical protein